MDLAHGSHSLMRLQLVDLGHDDDRIMPDRVEPGHGLSILVCHDATVHQQYNSEQRLATKQIVLQQGPPLTANGFRHVCKSIAGQIDELKLREMRI